MAGPASMSHIAASVQSNMRSGYIEDYLQKRKVQLARMTSFDRNLFDRESKSLRSNCASGRVLRYDSGRWLVGFGGYSTMRLTMLCDMFPHFGHSLTDGDIVVEELTVSSRLPFREGRELLGDGVEETNNDTDGGCLHVVAELVDSSSVGDSVVAIELHLFPDGEKDGGDHEYGGPVLEPIAAIHARVQRRQFFKDLLLKLPPHIGQGTFDLEVDHHWCKGLAA